MATVTNSPTTTEQYVLTLRDALEALGPEETEEVVAEIRGLLADAVADAGGDEDAAVVGFGSPEVLAARILEERGVIAGQTRVPDAPTSAQVVAALIDLVIALVGGVFILTLVGLLAAVIEYSGAPDSLVLGTIAAGMLGYWAAVVWWWARRRTRSGYASTGMQTAGLRRIRVGETTRTVRVRDINGFAGRRRAKPKVKTAVAVLLAALLLFGAVFLNELRWQSRVDEALIAASSSQQLVTAVYQQVIQGTETEQLQTYFTESARADMAALRERAASGELDSYEIQGLHLPDSPFVRAMRWDHSVSDTVLIEVTEYGRVGDPAFYVCRVTEVELPPVNGVGQSTLRIESVERDGFDFTNTSGEAEAVISLP